MGGQDCTYGCGTDASRLCTGGVWVKGMPTECPVSTRRVKRDIAYLTDSERAELAEEVRKLSLATYEYTDPALAGRRRLGFIIEDSPTSLAVDPERNQIDLYGYASMAVATMQVQAKEIEDLKREVRALSRDVAQSQSHANASCAPPRDP